MSLLAVSAGTGTVELALPTSIDVFERIVGTVAPEQLRVILQRLLTRCRVLQDLPAGWDSYGAPALSARTVDFALLFAARACMFLLRDDLPVLEPQIMPTRTGGVQLEWTCEPRELEIEIPQPDVFHVLAVEGDLEDEGPVTEDVAFRYLRWLATGQPT